MIASNSQLVRYLILERCAAAPNRQIAVGVDEDFCVPTGTGRRQMYDLLLDMRSRGQVELSIWHPVALEGDLAGFPHCVPSDEWKEWEPYEFFGFGVKDQGRTRISIPEVRVRH
jgi:hypothetical protein